VPRRLDRPLPAALTGGPEAPGAVATVGLRVPDHAAPRALAAAVGPLPTTSANRSGEPEARDAAEIELLLGDSLDLILDGGPSIGGQASTVVDATGDTIRILRVGSVPAAEIARALESAGIPGVGR
jgi:tRNA A37 threonylcarbamoyladenosine synthetase subunit TsaC/SUA5/YrdC